MNATGCHFPCCSCDSMAPVPSFDALTSTRKTPSSFGKVSTGSVEIASLMDSNAFCSSVSHFETFSPFPPFSAFSGAAITSGSHSCPLIRRLGNCYGGL
jgi:hypothetical protein